MSDERYEREDEYREQTEREDKDGLKDRHRGRPNKAGAAVRGRQSTPKKKLHQKRHACQSNTTAKQQTGDKDTVIK